MYIHWRFVWHSWWSVWRRCGRRWSGTQGIALTGSQMRFERRSEGTRGNDKRNAQKRNTAVVCGDYHKGVAICYTLFVVMCGRSRNRTQAKSTETELLNTRNRTHSAGRTQNCKGVFYSLLEQNAQHTGNSSHGLSDAF